jgi:hypothetical protein
MQKIYFVYSEDKRKLYYSWDFSPNAELFFLVWTRNEVSAKCCIEWITIIRTHWNGCIPGIYTDKKENQIFLIYKEIQSGAVTKSYMRKGFLIHMRKCANISPYMRMPLVIYDFATAPFWISLYMRKIVFSFLSVYSSMYRDIKWERRINVVQYCHNGCAWP